MSYPQYFGQTDKVHNTGVLIYGGDGTNARPILIDATGHVLLGANSGVDIGDVTLTAGTARIGTTSGVLKEIRVSQVIDGSLGAYAAGDVVGADDCCTTLAIPWIFDVARANGTYGYIVGATLVNETENQTPQYDLYLFNTTPTGELRDNAANTNPLKGDRSTYLGKIAFPAAVAGGATVATYTQATPSTVGNLPMPFKCTSGTTNLYGVLVTNTAYTQTATDDIEITLFVEQY